MARKRICLVCAEPSTFDAFLSAHAVRLGADYEVAVVANGRPRTADAVAAAFHVVPLERSVSPRRDLRALVRLVRLFRAERFDAVHSFTPKAGLLAMLAARRAKIPVRLHTFTGQVWATRRGFARYGLKRLDRILARCATAVLADSPSQADYLVAQGVVPRARISVIGDGSISGVNLERFRPDVGARQAVRAELQIAAAAPLLLFLGRLKREKGVVELAEAFRRSAATHLGVHLVFVGPDEEGLQPVLRGVLAPCAERVRFLGNVSQPERFFAAADMVCLPSHREGFGNVIIEAAACACATVASSIYGVTDAIDDGRTGLLHPPGDVDALTLCLQRMLAEPGLPARLGISARARAERLFSERRVTDGLASYYAGIMRATLTEPAIFGA
jgi:glycosyltransferase involved in cell wall biosynthesis